MSQPSHKRQSTLSTSVMKAVGIFGGVQSVGIICSIMRTKLVAIWIGAAGVGLFGIYNSVVDMISAIAQMGLRNSAVRDVAAAGDEAARNRVTVVVRRWGWALGLLGAVFTMALSPLLSEWSFGDRAHVWNFVLLSVAILAGTVTCCEQAILQGHERLRRIARSSMWGLASAFVVSVPLFYFLREGGVLWSVIAYSVCVFVAVMVYRQPASPLPRPMTVTETMREGRRFMVLGLYMTVSFFATMLAQYIFIAYLNHHADTSTVGYFQAGWTITTRYVGLVFTAISMEYFPRLSKVNDYPRRCGLFVSHEMTMSLWVLLPMITGLVTFSRLVVWLLYTSDFYVMLPYVTWAMVGTVPRAVSWCLAFVMLAKGDGRIYLLTELSSAVLSVVINILFYDWWGFLGLGVGYIVWYLLYTAIVWWVYRYRYGLGLSQGMWWLSLAVFAVAAVSVAAVSVGLEWVAGVVTVGAVAVSFGQLRRLISRR
ncbi:MAG: oligosaccharide flippase family protein [Pseudoflavonifractor sp.]|nr:oligosaccharide flippase family protein [Pseudoflavonifractor sp.]